VSGSSGRRERGEPASARSADRAPSKRAPSGGAPRSPIAELLSAVGNSAVTSLLDARTVGDERSLPAAAQDGSRAAGEPLDAGDRAELESQFGRDLGDVRIHRHAEAARSAEQMDAEAFTAGSHIVFGAGAYRPGAEEGRALLRHELAHVLQQRDAGSVRPGIGVAGDAFEQSADAAARGEVGSGTQQSAGGVPAAVQRQPKPGAKQPAPPTMPVGDVKVVDPAESKENLKPEELVKATIDGFALQHTIYSSVKSAAGGDAQLGQLLRLWKREVEVAIETIHGKLKDDAALTAQLEATYAEAMATVLGVYAASLGKPVTDLVKAHQDDLHEWAHVLPVSLTDAIPLADRRRIKVQTTQNVPSSAIDVKGLFATSGVKTTLPLPKDVEPEFSPTIAPALRAGLRNVAGVLTGQLKPPPLVLDSSISIALDLRSVGGDFAMYRFTYFTQHDKKAKHDRLLIERLRGLGTEGLSASESKTAQARFDAQGFKFTGSWGAGERDAVLRAVSMLPDSQLALIKGAKFERSSTATTDPNEGGHYDPNTHTVTLVALAFKPSLTRVDVAGGAPISFDTYTVLHEIGHAIDMRSIVAANATVASATAALRAEFGEYESPPKSGQFENVPGERLPRFRELLAKAATGAPKTESGHRLATDAEKAAAAKKGKTLPDIIADPAAKTAFRAAVAKDGGNRATPYADASWEEAFAESYSLYASDPATLERLRPAVFAFFRKNFPK
jgi:hypothetical protein